MPTHGLLKKVWDNKGHWGLVINVDDHGEHKLNLWDKKYAGIDSENNPAICDVHTMEGQRVVYTAKKGKLKDDSTTERWPATIEEIGLETPTEKPLDEQKPAQPPEPVEAPNEDELRRLTLAAIDAEVKAHETRIALINAQSGAVMALLDSRP